MYTSGYHSVDRLSDIDEFDESCKVVEEHGYYASDRSEAATPVDSLDNSSVDTGDILCDDDNDDRDESTPHILSETSKTQSPVSVDKLEEDDEQGQVTLGQGSEQQLDEMEEHSQVESDEPEKFNQTKTETAASEEIAFQIELESDKNKLTPESEEINAKQSEDNKITQQTFQQSKTCEESSSREEQAKTDFGNKNIFYKIFSDDIVAEVENSPHYRNGDEPEPIDLTFLNIEASMMCLASKVRTVCGKAHSPTLSNRTFRFKELDCKKKTRCCHRAKPFSKCQESQLIVENEEEGFQIPDVPRPGAAEEVRFQLLQLQIL